MMRVKVPSTWTSPSLNLTGFPGGSKPSREKTCCNTKVLCLLVFLASALLLLLSESGTFYWALRTCRFVGSEGTLLAAVSDVHVLGTKKAIWDIWWTDWQTRKSIWFIKKLIRPEALLVLGDHFDQGTSATDEEWEWYLERYRWIMKDVMPLAAAEVNERSIRRLVLTVIHSVIGNHDAQFAYLGLTDDMLARFESSFGPTNGLKQLSRVEIVWINAMSLFDNSTSGLSNAHLETAKFLDQLPKPTLPRILLSHVPAFRENDLECGKTRLREKKHVTYEAPEAPLRNAFDVFNEEVTSQLLSKAKPDVMLSGHLHSQCHRMMTTNDGHRFMDISVPSFSYRMRPDPGLVIVQIDYLLGDDVRTTQERIRGKTCQLPDERIVIALDVIAGIGMATSALILVVLSVSESFKAKPKVV